MRLRLVLLIAGSLLGAVAVLLGPGLPPGVVALFSDGSSPSADPAASPAATAKTATPEAASPEAASPEAASTEAARTRPASPGTQPPPGPTAPPAGSDTAADTVTAAPATPLEAAALRARLDDLLAPVVSSAPDPTLGLVVIDQHGALRYAHRGATAMIPASTQKLLTAAAALRSLGPRHRFTTRALGGASPTPDGVLAGDLLLRGSGDPTLTTPEFAALDPRRPSTPLAAVADQIAASGVRRISGRVLGDAGPFTADPLPEGWLPRYMTGLDGTRSAGLTVNAGRRLSIVDGQLRGEAAEDPVITAAAELVHLLSQRGVTVDGGAGRVAVGTARDDLRRQLGAVSSPPLDELLRFMVGASDNSIAEQLFLTVGLEAGGEATWAGGARGVRAALSDLPLSWSGVRLADGSGLSRANRVPATLLAELDLAMTRSELSEPWTSAMAVVGERGTLRARLRETVVDGRARGKTGSLTDVRALSGAVLGPRGEAYHFALLANDLDGPGVQAVRALQDHLLLALAEDLYGCVRVPLPAPTSSPGTPPGTSPPAATPSPPPAPFELVCAET